ncbi:hypothetical protein JOM56_012886, partial [Amanita muscaria]
KQKLEQVLQLLSQFRWTLSTLLLVLFRLEKPGTNGEPLPVERSVLHQRMVTAMLDGTTTTHFGEILEMIYHNAQRTSYRRDDDTRPSKGLFSTTHTAADIKHSQPAMVTWAVTLVSALVTNESSAMIDKDTGLHLRAQAKEGGRSWDYRATWDSIDAFSMKKLQETSKVCAPIMWHLMSAYVARPDAEESQQVQIVRRYRPQSIVCTSALMSMTFSRSNRASLYPLCRGVWLFAVKAHHSIFRVESRLGQSIAYSTVYEALRSMADHTMKDLRRDHRIGRENKMSKGLAGTAVEMEDITPEAFDLAELNRRQALQQRKTLTVDMILEDIDWEHIEHAGMIQFLQALIRFVPGLSCYEKEVRRLRNQLLCKNQLPKERCTNIIPLATNSCDEILVQEFKQGVLDFLSVQMGINADNLGNQLRIFSGDGKTFEQLLRLRKYLAAEEGSFESFRWLVPLLELWHTKWTDLSRVIRTHWGKETDPSALASAARIAECPTPVDLKKVDFYDGVHLLDLVLDAHILNCWEIHFETKDLTRLFEKPEDIPSFDSLVNAAHLLLRRHATTQAHERALRPTEDNLNPPPIGSAWTQERSDHNAENDENSLPPLDLPCSTREDADITLANTTLFMRNAIWWREMCTAVALGDTGRVWEILKIWIFTFAGSGNHFYTQYLLELYCNFKWEFSPALQQAILNNWLVNLHGKDGEWIEMDLMQEHFNFWLEDMAQHKGKDFDEPFYRSILSSNVHHFMQLKDEMEECVSLEGRRKRHSMPSTNNELRALMTHFRNLDVNKYRAGRDEGFHATDDFALHCPKVGPGRV